MASTEAKPHPESVKSEAAPPPPPPPPPCGPLDNFRLDVTLRVLLFAATLVALVVMATAKQTKMILVPGVPVAVAREAKFDHSPALIYFVVAMCVACLYSIITLLASLGVIMKPSHATKFLLHFAIWDVLMLGLVASAAGTAGAVAYIGLKGNSHTNWAKICNVYDKFCRHVGSSVAISLLASILLVLLTMLSILSLSRRIRE